MDPGCLDVAWQSDWWLSLTSGATDSLRERRGDNQYGKQRVIEQETEYVRQSETELLCTTTRRVRHNKGQRGVTKSA